MFLSSLSLFITLSTMLLAPRLRSSWGGCSSARGTPGTRVTLRSLQDLVGTGQGQRGKDRLWVYVRKILVCLGVKKASKVGEIRAGRCHTSVGGSTGFESTSGIGFIES